MSSVARPKRLIAYVDGFNLYRGLREKQWRKYYWLDLIALCERFRESDETLSRVRYFTTRVRREVGDDGESQRQDSYLQALQAHNPGRLQIQWGGFKRHEERCAGCGKLSIRYSEKKSDVNMATNIVVDALRGYADRCLVISGDSDVVPAIKAVSAEAKQVRLGAAFPPGRVSSEIRGLVSSSREIVESDLAGCQLPATVTKPDDFEIRRPAEWA